MYLSDLCECIAEPYIIQGFFRLYPLAGISGILLLVKAAYLIRSLVIFIRSSYQVLESPSPAMDRYEYSIRTRPSAPTLSSSSSRRRPEIVDWPSSSSSRTQPTQPSRPQTTDQPTNTSAASNLQAAMTVGCEVETNLRARDSRNDISRFGNDQYALTDFASNVCEIFNTKMSERRNGVRMRVKGDLRYPQEHSIGLWTIERDGSIRKDNRQQVSLEIVSPIMICDITEMWRKDVESMYKYLGAAFYFEANVSGFQNLSLLVCLALFPLSVYSRRWNSAFDSTRPIQILIADAPL